MNTHLKNMPTSPTIYFNINSEEISAAIFDMGGVIYAKKVAIEQDSEMEISDLAVKLLLQTIEFTPPSLSSRIRKKGIVVSGDSVPDDTCTLVQQKTGIHAQLIGHASDISALATCMAWLQYQDCYF